MEETSFIDGVIILDEPYFESPVISGARYADPISERRRRVENITLGRILVEKFRSMNLEVKNGFGELSKNKRVEMISDRKREARGVLHYGSLFPHEMMGLIDMVNEKVERIYGPV